MLVFIQMRGACKEQHTAGIGRVRGIQRTGPFLSSKLVEVRREHCAPRLGHAAGNLVRALRPAILGGNGGQGPAEMPGAG